MATPAAEGTAATMGRTATDVGNIMATGGQVMLMLYACLLIIFMLLIFLYLKEWLNQRRDAQITTAMNKIAEALMGLQITMVRDESTRESKLEDIISQLLEGRLK